MKLTYHIGGPDNGMGGHPEDNSPVQVNHDAVFMFDN